MIFIFFLLFHSYNCFRFLPHPLESRISYIEGIKDVRNIDKGLFECCKTYFEQSSPLIIFKNQPEMTPQEFLDFAKLFDDNRDEDAINCANNNNQSYNKDTTIFIILPNNNDGTIMVKNSCYVIYAKILKNDFEIQS